jgi:hypothetical protein
MGAYQAGLILLRLEDYPKAAHLSGVDRLTLTTLFSFAADNDRPQAFPSAERVAARAGLARRTVQRSLDHLEEVGVITGVHRQRRPTRWSLDAHFTKAGGVTQSPASVRESPAKRHSDASEASERRHASATVTHQLTEVSSGTKRRNCTDVKGGSASGGGSAAPSPPPPPGQPEPWPAGTVPPDVVPTVTVKGKPLGTRKEGA